MFADVNRHLRNRQSKSTTPALLKKSSGAVHILACYFRRCGITRRYVAARPIGILEADTKERWCICNGFNVLNIKSISFHFKQQLSTSRIATNLSNRDKVDRSFRQFTSEKRGQVVHDDVKLAVVTRINKVFLLDERYVPATSIAQWEGAVELRPGGPPLEIPVK